jgi:hypothetical protein
LTTLRHSLHALGEPALVLPPPAAAPLPAEDVAALPPPVPRGGPAVAALLDDLERLREDGERLAAQVVAGPRAVAPPTLLQPPPPPRAHTPPPHPRPRAPPPAAARQLQELARLRAEAEAALAGRRGGVA